MHLMLFIYCSLIPPALLPLMILIPHFLPPVLVYAIFTSLIVIFMVSYSHQSFLLASKHFISSHRHSHYFLAQQGAPHQLYLHFCCNSYLPLINIKLGNYCFIWKRDSTYRVKCIFRLIVLFS